MISSKCLNIDMFEHMLINQLNVTFNRVATNNCKLEYFECMTDLFNPYDVKSGFRIRDKFEGHLEIIM